MSWTTILLLVVVGLEAVAILFLLYIIWVAGRALAQASFTIQELMGSGVIKEAEVATHLLERAKRYERSRPEVCEALRGEAMRVTGLSKTR